VAQFACSFVNANKIGLGPKKTQPASGTKNNPVLWSKSIYDHLGEVHGPRTPRSRTWPRGVPGNDILAMLLKQKLLGTIKTVILSYFGTAMTIWVKSMDLWLHGVGPDQGVSQRMVLSCLQKFSKWKVFLNTQSIFMDNWVLLVMLLNKQWHLKGHHNK
jgi:hypothetical protein